MTNFDPTKLDWTDGLLAGWTYDKPVNKWFQGAFRHAHRLTRPCPTCSDVIVLDVTAKALEGNATNHGLALRRCKMCRNALKAGPQAYAVRKEAVADKPVAPAPVQVVVQPAPAVPAEIMQEMETLRTVNATMKEELDGLYMQLKELRGRLASYEPAERPTAPKPVQYRLPPDQSLSVAAEATAKAAKAFKERDFPRNEEMLKAWIAKNNAKMPWEGG